MRCVWSKCFPLHWHFHCDRGKKAALRPKTDFCGQSESFSFFFNANAQATGDEHVVVKSSRTKDSHFKNSEEVIHYSLCGWEDEYAAISCWLQEPKALLTPAPRAPWIIQCHPAQKHHVMKIPVVPINSQTSTVETPVCISQYEF